MAYNAAVLQHNILPIYLLNFMPPFYLEWFEQNVSCEMGPFHFMGGFDANSGIYLMGIVVISKSWKSGMMCSSSPSKTNNKTSTLIPWILALTYAWQDSSTDRLPSIMDEVTTMSRPRVPSCPWKSEAQGFEKAAEKAVKVTP